jgi:hypothetical protein
MGKDRSELPDEWKWRYNVYLGLGCYAYYLERIFQIFPKERVRVFFSEEFRSAPIDICSSLFEDLGVDPGYQPDTSIEVNKASEARSVWMASFLRTFVHRENLMKRVLKRVFPSHLLARGARGLKAMNQRELSKEGIGKSEKDRLREFYAPWNERLKQLIHRDPTPWWGLEGGPKKDESL